MTLSNRQTESDNSAAAISTKSSIHLQPVEGPSAWRSADFSRDKTWILPLSEEHIADIDRALQRAKRDNATFATLNKSTFPLPSMKLLLDELRQSLLTGRGFALVKGLPVHKYTVKETELIFWGIGAHLGTGVTQNAAADFISHVYDRGLNYGDRTVRAYQVRDALAMHCDNSDMVGLLCIRAAKSGGASLLTSSMTVFNEILRTRPEYMSVLFSGFVYDRKNEQGAGEDLFTQKIPIFSSSNGVVSCRYARSYIQHAQATTGVKLSPVEQEAISYFEAVASRPDLQLEMDLEPGDMQFANNYTVMHARRGFENYAEPERGRLLLRLWLEVQDVRDISSEIVRHGFHHFGNLGRSTAEWAQMQQAATQK
jgi:hypothetical protein